MPHTKDSSSDSSLPWQRQFWSPESLRDHPIFEVPDNRPGNIASRMMQMIPADRDSEWQKELYRLFGRRASALVAATALAIPFFSAIYSVMVPEARETTLISHALMMAFCVVFNFALQRANTLTARRILTFAIYIVFSITSAMIMVNSNDVRVSSFSGHPQLLISLLFLPLAFSDAVLCATIIIVSFSFGLRMSLPDSQIPVVWLVTASFSIAAALVVLLTHAQNVIRRYAFNNTFDLAISASRNAALSNLDTVTGGFNRRHITNMLELELSRALRYGQPLSILMFDLDNFKSVNDTNGHAAGDQVLREVLTASMGALRSIDTVGRYGGDEFTVILPATAQDSAEHVAGRLHEVVIAHLKKKFTAESLESKVTLSIGVATFGKGDNVTVEKALEKADLHLYSAKRRGKNCVYAGEKV